MRVRWPGRKHPADAKPARKCVERRFELEATLPATPEQVFPLLCPIREREWIEGWRADAVHTVSGHAERGALFRTRLGHGELWVTTTYEPSARVEYTIFAGRRVVVRLDLRLAANADGTTHWRVERTYTGIGWLGRRRVAALSEAQVHAEHERLRRQLDHFLRTGRMLHGAGGALRGMRGVSGPSTDGTRA
jgi:hypothetical protein